MTDKHITQWLHAYHDGELRGRRLAQVEAHLATCAACQAELDALDQLAGLLAEAPAPDTGTSPEQFAAQVNLRLPRKAPATDQPAQMQHLRAVGWYLVPLALIATVVVVQARNLATRLFGPLLGTTSGTASPFDCLNTLLTAPDLVTLVGCASDLLTIVTVPLTIAVLYLAWLGLWWVRDGRTE